MISGDLESVKLLLDEDETRVNGTTLESDTWPVHLAVRRGGAVGFAILEELLNRGANVEGAFQPDAHVDPCTLPETPLIEALARGEHAIAALLLDRGANPDDTYGDGSAALVRLCGHYRYPSPEVARDLVALLLNHGANVDGIPPDSEDHLPMEMPLPEAYHHDSTKIVELLVSRGASWCPNEEKDTALHVATRDGKLRMAKIIFKKNKTHLYKKKKNGETPLGIALRRDDKKLLKIFSGEK